MDRRAKIRKKLDEIEITVQRWLRELPQDPLDTSLARQAVTDMEIVVDLVGQSRWFNDLPTLERFDHVIDTKLAEIDRAMMVDNGMREEPPSQSRH